MKKLHYIQPIVETELMPEKALMAFNNSPGAQDGLDPEPIPAPEP